MRKLFLLLMIMSFLFSGCNEKNDEYDFEGISFFSSMGWELLTIFVEDNYGGYEIIRDQLVNQDFDLEHYWVEAYGIHITENTKLIMATTGEEFTFTYPDNYVDMYNENRHFFELLYPGRRVAVKVEEKFEKTILENRNGYILSNNELFPIYTPKEIKILPLTFNDFLLLNSAPADGFMVIGIFEELDDEDGIDEFEQKYWDELYRLDDLIFQKTHQHHLGMMTMDKEMFLEYPVPVESTNYPLFLILDSEDNIIEMNNLDDVIQFFEEYYEVEFEREEKI